MTTGQRKSRKRTASMSEIEGRLERQEAAMRRMSRELDEMRAAARRNAEVIAVLGVKAGKKGGKSERSIIPDLQNSVIKMEEYLLRTSSRIENILNALKTHREFITRVNKKMFKTDAKDMMRMELDIMKNTLSILAMNGVDFDSALPKDIEKLRQSLDEKEAELGELRKRKEKLDERFSVELKRFDLESIYMKRKILPGYM